MQSERLERKIEKASRSGSISITEEIRSLALTYALSLYYHSIGVNELSPSTREAYINSLQEFKLPQKLFIWRELKKEGAFGGNHSESYTRAAKYFWNNFIRLDREKMDRSVTEYLALLQEEQLEKSA